MADNSLYHFMKNYELGIGNYQPHDLGMKYYDLGRGINQPYELGIGNYQPYDLGMNNYDLGIENYVYRFICVWR